MKKFWILSNSFFALIDNDAMLFVFFSLLICNIIILIDSHIARIDSSYLVILYFLKSFFSWPAGTLSRISASEFLRDVGSSILSCTLHGFGIRVTLASRSEQGNISSFWVFWKRLQRVSKNPVNLCWSSPVETICVFFQSFQWRVQFLNGCRAILLLLVESQ